LFVFCCLLFFLNRCLFTASLAFLMFLQYSTFTQYLRNCPGIHKRLLWLRQWEFTAKRSWSVTECLREFDVWKYTSLAFSGLLGPVLAVPVIFSEVANSINIPTFTTPFRLFIITLTTSMIYIYIYIYIRFLWNRATWDVNPQIFCTHKARFKTIVQQQSV
jgi:hypothetical protein